MPWSSLLLAGILVTGAGTQAQQPASRAEEEARKRSEKAAASRPASPNRVEQRFLAIEESGGFLSSRNGWYVTFGGIRSGAGYSMGPAYGRVFDSGASVEFKAGYSVRNFKLLQVSAQSQPLARGRLRFRTRARWVDAPVIPYYELGMASPQTKAYFSEQDTEVSGDVSYEPVSFFRLSGGMGVESWVTGPPDSDSRTPIDQQFEDVPGLYADPRYLHSFALAALDWRDGRTYSRHGTFLGAALHDYRQQDDGQLSFRRVDAQAQQFIPIFHGNNVFVLSLSASMTSPSSSADVVPYFMLPTLGGSSWLRGFDRFRFRDRHSLLFTGEYRWYVQEFADVALFYDAGKVTSRASDLDFTGMKGSLGIGLRFHGPGSTVLRLELAGSPEGARFTFGVGAARELVR